MQLQQAMAEIHVPPIRRHDEMRRNLPEPPSPRPHHPRALQHRQMFEMSDGDRPTP